jgi:hypothetical protein
LVAQGENIYSQATLKPKNRKIILKTSNSLIIGDNFELRDFACEIFFDFLKYLDQSEQPQILLDSIRSWKKSSNISTYYILLLQNFLRKVPLISLKTFTPEELESAENLRAILTEIEAELAALTKNARREFKNRGQLNKYN